MKRKSLQNVFSDTSSLVFRSLLREPERRWKQVQLSCQGISQGLVSEVLSKSEALGYVERVSKGPDSFTRLVRKENLLKDWLRSYSFDRNQQVSYLYVGNNFLKKCHPILKRKGIPHAVTLYSASRLISSYVKDDRHFIYLNVDQNQWGPLLKEIEIELHLYQLIQGGNVCFVRPYYRNALFKDSQKIKGYPVVSNLQLYLDLMTFPPSGPEEVRHLVHEFKKKGHVFV